MPSKSRITLLLFLAACGGEGTTAVKSSVTAVVVSPATASLVIGGTATFTAVARDSKGATVAGHFVTWSTQSSGVLTINTSGVATAVGPGTASVTATQADAAAFALGYQIRRAIVATPPTTTLADALRGEQVRELGLTVSRSGEPVVSFSPLGGRQVFFGGRWVFADGAP